MDPGGHRLLDPTLMLSKEFEFRIPQSLIPAVTNVPVYGQTFACRSVEQAKCLCKSTFLGDADLTAALASKKNLEECRRIYELAGDLEQMLQHIRDRPRVALRAVGDPLSFWCIHTQSIQ